MIAIEDICTKKCENFNGIDKKSFQKIIDLREKSKGDKIYDMERSIRKAVIY